MPIVQAIVPNQISSMKPSKRKIVRTIYTAEKVTKSIQNNIPQEARGIFQLISDTCKNIRLKLTEN